jgi:hypothetical protein
MLAIILAIILMCLSLAGFIKAWSLIIAGVGVAKALLIFGMFFACTCLQHLAGLSAVAWRVKRR